MTTDPTTHRHAWVKATVAARTPHTGVTPQQHARMVAAAEREWARIHPAMARRAT
jgi:hypothetical protein